MKKIIYYTLTFLLGLVLISGSCTKPDAVTEITKQGVKLLLIKGGSFVMGSPIGEVGRNAANETQHIVTLSNFYISETAITNEQYCRFLNANQIDASGRKATIQNNEILVSTHGSCPWGVVYNNATNQWQPQPGMAYRPVIVVSWYGAKAFCDWAGGRLPTEAEWEYACRAGSTTPFAPFQHWNGQFISTQIANFRSEAGMEHNGYETGTLYRRCTVEVKEFYPNQWGLYQMHGNVVEWCNDWFANDYGCGNSNITNPKGPNTGLSRTVRGGGWDFFASACRSAWRDPWSPDTRQYNLGFRMASSL